MVDMVKIVHNNYEKITDDLFWISPRWILKFNVKLNKYNDKYGRMNYHKEIMYTKGKDTYININRSFEYYLTIESTFKNDSNQKECIFISSIDFYMFKQRLNMAMEWFTSVTYKDLFAKKDGKIFMPRGISVLDINLRSSLLQIEPTILEMDNNDQIIGVNLFINKYEKVFIDVNKFLALVDMINSLNMFQSAQIMLTYLQKPEPGDNIYDMGNVVPDYNTVDDSKTVFPKKQDDGLGFFNRTNRK